MKSQYFFRFSNIAILILLTNQCYSYFYDHPYKRNSDRNAIEFPDDSEYNTYSADGGEIEKSLLLKKLVLSQSDVDIPENAERISRSYGQCTSSRHCSSHQYCTIHGYCHSKCSERGKRNDIYNYLPDLEEDDELNLQVREKRSIGCFEDHHCGYGRYCSCHGRCHSIKRKKH